MKTTKFKKLLLIGLGNIVSGIFFGTGCILIEHIDNTWWHADKDTSPPGETVANDDADSGNSPVGLAVKSVKTDSYAPGLASRRQVK